MLPTDRKVLPLAGMPFVVTILCDSQLSVTVFSQRPSTRNLPMLRQFGGLPSNAGPRKAIARGDCGRVCAVSKGMRNVRADSWKAGHKGSASQHHATTEKSRRCGAACQGALPTSRKQLRHYENGVMKFRVFSFSFSFTITCARFRLRSTGGLETLALPCLPAFLQSVSDTLYW
jgi:hypothetical protein